MGYVAAPIGSTEATLTAISNGNCRIMGGSGKDCPACLNAVWNLKMHMEGEGAKYEGICRDVFHGDTLVAEAIEFETAQKLVDYLNALP